MLILRFLSKVKITSLGDCWTWAGAIHSSGYGYFRSEGRTEGAHRASYRLFKGPIPTGMRVCHQCDNPPCVNPFHLFLGTQKQNMQDAAKKGRMSGPRRQYISVPKSDETHPRAKLTNEQVRFIRSNSKDLASQFGVSRWTIRRVRNLKAYRDVR